MFSMEIDAQQFNCREPLAMSLDMFFMYFFLVMKFLSKVVVLTGNYVDQKLHSTICRRLIYRSIH